jgi:hypothetical protein
MNVPIGHGNTPIENLLSENVYNIPLNDEGGHKFLFMTKYTLIKTDVLLLAIAAITIALSFA